LLNQIADVDVYGGGYNLEEALKVLSGEIKQNSMIIIVSDFIGLQKNWKNYLSLVGTNSHIVAIMVRDPIDYSLEKLRGDFVLKDLDSEEKIAIDNRAKKSYEISSKKNVLGIEQEFRLANALFFPLRTDVDFLDSFVNFGGGI